MIAFEEPTIVGALGAAFVTVKVLVDTTVPPGPVTEMVPVLAPLGTVVANWMAVRVPITAAAAPKFTAVTVSRLVPVMVTGVMPAVPLVGEMLVMVGAPGPMGGVGRLTPPLLQDINKPRPRAAQPLMMEPNQAAGRMTNS